MSKNTKPFEKRFYNESTITYETAPDQGFQAFFLREEREVVITHTTEKAVKTYSAKAHPDDQYDEHFGFELAAARLWWVYLGSLEKIHDFLAFRQYVWGVKGWGVLEAPDYQKSPQSVLDLLAASKDLSFRQRVVEVSGFKILEEYERRGGEVLRKTSWRTRAIDTLRDHNLEVVDLRIPVRGENFLAHSALLMGPLSKDYSGYLPETPRVIVRRRDDVVWNGYSTYKRAKPEVSGSADAVVGTSLIDVKTPSTKTETPFEIITRYKETTERGKIDKKTSLQLWKDLKDAGYTPVDVRDAKKGDKFFWSNFCNEVLPVDGDGWEGVDDPALILAKTVKETPATPAPEPTQEDRWIDQESKDWHCGETAAQRAARVRAYLKEKGLKVVDYRVSTRNDFHIRQDGAEDPIRNIAGGYTFGGKRLIVEPITPVPSPADEKALNFIRQEFREDGNERFISKAEGLLKQYREWGFEPVDYRQVRIGEYYGSAYTGYHPEQRTERESYLNFLIFSKRS